MYLPYTMHAGLQVTCDVKWCAHKGKVFSLTWLRSFNRYGHTLLSCGPHGEMVCLNVLNIEVSYFPIRWYGESMAFL